MQPNELKASLRKQAYDVRRGQPDKDRTSMLVMHKVWALPEFPKAETVLWYLDSRSEVRTSVALTEQLLREKRIAVPYCTVDQRDQPMLGLWHLESKNELSPGKWNILEPPATRWQEAGRVVPEQLDMVLVPGVAFDRQGARLGSGQGYYDRLLPQVRKDCLLVGAAYECQIVDDLVVEPHDIPMDVVVTESNIYRRRTSTRKEGSPQSNRGVARREDC